MSRCPWWENQFTWLNKGLLLFKSPVMIHWKKSLAHWKQVPATQTKRETAMTLTQHHISVNYSLVRVLHVATLKMIWPQANDLGAASEHRGFFTVFTLNQCLDISACHPYASFNLGFPENLSRKTKTLSRQQAFSQTLKPGRPEGMFSYKTITG